MELNGQSFIGGRRGSSEGAGFQAMNPQSGAALDPIYHSATAAEVDEAVKLASQAFASYSQTSSKACAALLRRAAEGFERQRDALAERAHLETALPMPRLLGEVSRTAGQLRLFASVVEEGSWVNARVDPALPDRQPMPRPDIRSMLRPLGPVAVFGASNFPLPFQWPGGTRPPRWQPAVPSSSRLIPPILELANLPRKSSQRLSQPKGCIPAFFPWCSIAGWTRVRRW